MQENRLNDKMSRSLSKLADEKTEIKLKNYSNWTNKKQKDWLKSRSVRIKIEMRHIRNSRTDKM